MDLLKAIKGTYSKQNLMEKIFVLVSSIWCIMCKRRKYSPPKSHLTDFYPLKVVCYIFGSLFLSLNKSIFETWENVFYFYSKALFIHKKIKFQNFRFHYDNIKCLSIKQMYFNKSPLYQKSLQELQPENQIQAFLFLERIKHNLTEK